MLSLQKGCGLSSFPWIGLLPSRHRALDTSGMGSSGIQRGRFSWLDQTLWLVSDPDEESTDSPILEQWCQTSVAGETSLAESLWKRPVSKSGNGRIWKHLPVCTNGRAGAHKRLLSKAKLSNPFCSSTLFLIHMTVFNLSMVLALFQKRYLMNYS